MSAAARIVLVVLAIALAGVGAGYWWVTREVPEEVPVGETRVLTVDPTIALPVILDIPTDANGCPGYTVPAPAEPFLEPIVGTDGSRQDAAIHLADDVIFMSVCLGAVADIGDVDEVVDQFLDTLGEPVLPDAEDPAAAAVARELVGAVDQIRSAHGDGPAVTTSLGTSLLTDFYVERDGYVHVAGYLRPESVGDTYLPTVETMLASWSWD